MKSTREDPFIKLFLSAYENFSWADAVCAKPDAMDRNNQAVDQIATRKDDGRILAIEHTIIQPFVDDLRDLDSFKEWFLGIEKDESLLVPGRYIQVFVPVGTLQNQPRELRDGIVLSVHQWVKSNRLILQDGISKHACSIKGPSGKPQLEIMLNVEAMPLQSERGCLHIRRQEVGNSLGDVIEKALKKKLPKLVNAKADKRILLLERQHMNLDTDRMLGEIEKRRSLFSSLSGVDEIWILGTMFYGTAFGGTYLGFMRYEGGHIAGRYDFDGGKLMMKLEDSETSYQ